MTVLFWPYSGQPDGESGTDYRRLHRRLSQDVGRWWPYGLTTDALRDTESTEKPSLHLPWVNTGPGRDEQARLSSTQPDRTTD
jgi:hypothetical protein